jgi:hypothetical protein
VHVASLPARERLDVVRDRDHPHEWWVTVDGRHVVGFCGDDARPRAEQYFFELSTICGGDIHRRDPDR